MKLRTRRTCSHVVIGIFFFLGGVEYAVILPTAWFYLQQRFDAPSYMLGFLISSFCLSSLIAGPVMGRWSDKVGKTKHIFLFANLFEIVGNVMYFLGISSWMLVAGRFVAGIGAGVGAPIIADITRVTSNTERTGVISIFMAVRQFGLIIGPGFNLFLREMNFRIGSFPVDKYSAPGAFMAVLWILLEIMVVALYWDLPALYRAIVQQSIAYDYRESESQYQQPDSPAPSVLPVETDMITGQDLNECSQIPYDSTTIPPVVCMTPQEWQDTGQQVRHPQLDGMFTSSSEMIESAERFIATARSTDTTDQSITFTQPTNEPSSADYENGFPNQDEESPGSSSRPASSLSFAFYYDEFIREEIIAILAVVFIAFFNQTCMEAVITPFAEQLLDWNELEISLLYCGAGVEILLVFLLITYLSKHLQDRTLLLLGYLVVLITIGALVWYIPNAPPHNLSYNLPFFLTGVVLDVFGLPFLVVTSTSLYSKITREETQGLSQGIRGACGGIGTLLGPLWADSLIDKAYLMLGVMLGLMLIALGMFLMSFKSMKDQRTITHVGSSHSVNSDTTEENERRPLLGNQ